MPATTERRLFSRTTTVAVPIAASAERVWALLTDATRLPRWTSTIVSIDGAIVPDGRVTLVSSLDPTRTFRLRVKRFDPPRALAWGDAMGTRTFEVTPRAEGGVDFRMSERIGGPLFPLFARMIPPFDAAFDQFAGDLQRAAESGASS